MYIRMYVHMYVCTYVCMYVCMYVPVKQTEFICHICLKAMKSKASLCSHQRGHERHNKTKQTVRGGYHLLKM